MWCLRPPTTSESPTTPLSTIIITANIVSRPTVGASPPSITALISITSTATIENVRISVPNGSPSISARWSAATITPNAHHRITPRIQMNSSPPIGTLSRLAFDSSESPKNAKAPTVPQPASRCFMAAAREVAGDDVPVVVGFWSSSGGGRRRSRGPRRAPHEVVVVGRDHADLVRLEAERVDAGEVDPRVRLVGVRDLGAEDRVPGSLAYLARLTDCAMWPFEQGAMMWVAFRRVRPSTTSGHGSSLCQALTSVSR